jgi:hypothetical protein
MGRPCRCCGCEAPVVECRLDSGYFYYTILNAETATLDNDVITLDADGNASGVVPIRSGWSHTVVATNKCGTSVCKKDCYSILCYEIYKLGDPAHLCSGSARQDVVTIEVFVRAIYATGAEVNANTKFYVNSHLINMAEDTRALGCGYFSGQPQTGLFGRLEINRCDLEDAYYLFVDLTGDCGPPVMVDGDTSYYISCQHPWFPQPMEKVNTAIIEVNLSDGYSYSRTSNRDFGDRYDSTTTNQYNLSGMSVLNGTYQLPIVCGTTRQLYNNNVFDGLDPCDELGVALPRRALSLGIVTVDQSQTNTYVHGYYGTDQPTDIYQTYTRTITKAMASIVIEDDAPYGSMYFTFAVTEKTTITENYDGLGLYSRNRRVCTTVTDPNLPCYLDPRFNKLAECTNESWSRNFGSQNYASDVCNSSTVSNDIYGWYLPLELGHCTVNSDGDITSGPSFQNTGSSNISFGILGPLSTSTNPDIDYLCYFSGSYNCAATSINDPTYLNCQRLTPARFGEVRSYYECL